MLSAAAPSDTPEVVLSRKLAACGFVDTELSYVADMQEDGIRVLGISEATDDQLTCAAKASIETVIFVEMPDNLKKRYVTIYYAIQAAESLKESRQWLANRGLLDKLPIYLPGRDDEFADRLEKVCGKRAQGALGRGSHAHELSPQWFKQNRKPSVKASEAFECVMRGASVANYSLGLIGNEAVAPERKP